MGPDLPSESVTGFTRAYFPPELCFILKMQLCVLFVHYVIIQESWCFLVKEGFNYLQDVVNWKISWYL